MPALPPKRILPPAIPTARPVAATRATAGATSAALGERGTGPGQFWLPNGIFIDDQDRIYVADSYNQRIQVFQYLKSRGQGAESDVQGAK